MECIQPWLPIDNGQTIKKAIFLPGSFVAGGGPRPRPAKVTRKEKKEPKKEPKAMTKEERVSRMNNGSQENLTRLY